MITFQSLIELSKWLDTVENTDTDECFDIVMRAIRQNQFSIVIFKKDRKSPYVLCLDERGCGKSLHDSYWLESDGDIKKIYEWIDKSIMPMYPSISFVNKMSLTW